MNLDLLDKTLKDNQVAQISSMNLFGLLMLAVIVGYLLAWVFRNRYDGSHLVKLFLWYLPAHLLISYFLLPVPVVLGIGTYLLGAVATFVKSNRYFYQ